MTAESVPTPEDLRAEVEWLSEACRLTVREATNVRADRDRLLKDATPARQKLMDLIGGDRTVETSLTDLATYAARFWGDDRKEIERLRNEAEKRERELTEYKADQAHLLVETRSLRAEVVAIGAQRDDAEEERASMIRDLNAALFDGSTLLPDRPLDTVWEYLLGLVRQDRARLSAESLTIPDDAAAQLLLDAALEYQTARDIEDPEHNIDDAYYLAQAAFQARKLREAGWGAPARPDEAAAQIEAVIAGVCTGQDDANGHIIYFIDDVGSPADVAQLVLKLITSPGWGSAVTNPTGAPAAEQALRAELRIEEENVEFAEKTLHLVLGCCDGEQDECRGLEPVYASVRAGERPPTLPAEERSVRLFALVTDLFGGVRDAMGKFSALVDELPQVVAPSPAGDATDAEAREFAEDMHHQATFRPVLDVVPPPTPAAVECKAHEGAMGVDCHLAAGHDGWHDAHHSPRTDGTESIGYAFDIQWPRNEWDRCAPPAPLPPTQED